MMFVYVIARLKKDLDACHKRLDDLDDMALEILKSGEPHTAADEAMMALIQACEDQDGDEVRRLTSSLKEYEDRRDFRA